MFYGSYPPEGGSGGGGVTSLNGLTGAITLVGAGGITITPSGSNITIDGSGIVFANQHLSNLLSPTAINQDLLPGVTNTINIGNPSHLFASVSAVEYDVFTSGGVIGGSMIASGPDLELSSPNGSILLAATTGGKDIQLNSPTVLTNATVIKTISDLQADLGTAALRFNHLFLANLVLSSGVGSTITQLAAASTTPYSIKWPAAQGAASTVLTNDGAGNLSWAASGSSGANQHLSNLLSPTAINQDLIFDEGAPATVKTKDDVIATQSLTIASGNANTTGASGDLSLITGSAVDNTTGQINIVTGAPSNANQNSGGIISATGAVTGNSQSGVIQFISGSAVDTASGAVQLQSGSVTGSGTSGAATLTSGSASGAGGTGSTSVNTGSSLGGDTGNIFITTGGTATSGNSGSVNIQTGAAQNGSAGAIQLLTSTDNTTSGGIGITTGTGGASASGNVLLTTGNTSGNAGSVSLTSGNSAGGSGNGGQLLLTSGNSDSLFAGAITLLTGTGSASPRGLIQFQNGSEGTAGQVWTSTDAIGSGTWASIPAGATNNKELFTLSSGDITNQFIDLSHVALNNSVDFLVQGAGTQIEGVSFDYSVNYTGGAGGNTRITFLNGLATGGGSALVAGNVVVAKYQY